MLEKPAQWLKGSAALLALSLNTVFFCSLIFILALVLLVMPVRGIRNGLRRLLAWLAQAWVSVNNFGLSLFSAKWEWDLPDTLDRKGCYLVIANHQSWVDIPVLQRGFNRKLPFFRFFLKSQLIWVPMLGLAWWALDFPFMKRHSREQLEKNPELRARDLQSARSACEKFRDIPVAMMNFPEGTRFSNAKRDASGSPYRHLLKPKSGGNAVVLYALAEQLQGVVDVTIAYPGRKAPSLWELVSGQVERIVVQARILEIPPDLLGRDYQQDPEYRAALKSWFEQIWFEKDQQLGLINRESKNA